MPGAAEDMGVDRAIPSQNVQGGVGYFKRQMDAFGDEDKALAAYYAGPGRVQQALRERPQDWTGWLDENTGQPFGQPPPSQYIAEVTGPCRPGHGTSHPARYGCGPH